MNFIVNFKGVLGPTGWHPKEENPANLAIAGFCQQYILMLGHL